MNVLENVFGSVRDGLMRASDVIRTLLHNEIITTPTSTNQAALPSTTTTTTTTANASTVYNENTDGTPGSSSTASGVNSSFWPLLGYDIRILRAPATAHIYLNNYSRPYIESTHSLPPPYTPREPLPPYTRHSRSVGGNDGEGLGAGGRRLFFGGRVFIPPFTGMPTIWTFVSSTRPFGSGRSPAGTGLPTPVTAGSVPTLVEMGRPRRFDLLPGIWRKAALVACGVFAVGAITALAWFMIVKASDHSEKEKGE